MDCLALTGTDSTLPLVIGLTLLLAGIAAVAVVAWRRNRRAGAALLLALVLAVGGGAALAVPQPALAASTGCSDAGPGDPGAPGTPGSPSAPCTPTPAVPDVTADVRGGWQAGDPSAIDLPLDGAGALAWQTALDAVHAIDPAAAVENGVLRATSGATTQTRAVTAPGFTGTGGDVPANAVYVQPADFDAAVIGLSTATVELDFDLTYPDGCGAMLDTHFSTQGLWTAPPPPVCVPAVAVDTPAISDTGDWFPVDATHEGLTITTAEVQQLTGELAAIHAIDPHPTVLEGLNLFQGSTFQPSGWEIDGTTFEVSLTAYNAIVAGIDSGGGVFEASNYTYPDGCGGTLKSVISVLGHFPSIIT